MVICSLNPPTYLPTYHNLFIYDIVLSFTVSQLSLPSKNKTNLISFRIWFHFSGLNATWSYKYTYLCALSVRHRFMYLTARFAAVSKINFHWVALKHRLNTWTLAHLYYVDIGTYYCFYCVATETYCGGSEFKYPGTVAKNEYSIVLEICPTPNPTLNLPDSKQIQILYKNVFVDATVPFQLSYMESWNALSNRDYTGFELELLAYVSVLRELPNKLTVYENP